METNQDLVQIGNKNAEMAQYVAPEVDETGLDAVALKPSNIILVQNTTREPGTARSGQLLDVLSREVYDEITVVPLKLMKQRVLFPPGADLDAEAVCRSNDGVVPSPFAKAPQSYKCVSCPRSQWVNGEKSECSEKLKLLVVAKETGVPYFFNFGGKSITTLRTALQLIKRYIAMNDATIKATGQGAPLHLYDFFFTIKGEIVTGKYRFALARFDNIKRVATVGDFGPLFEKFVLRARQQSEEEAEQQKEIQANQATNEVVQAELVSEV